ncbi:MAG: DUF3137 domain-containing protein [Clostridia bacterium]|nr:DUF3137 domain-containing protein [Clostridia bacterium]
MSFLLDKIREIEKMQISDEEKKKKVDLLRCRVTKISAEKRARDSKMAILAFLGIILMYVFFFSLESWSTSKNVWMFFNSVIVIGIIPLLTCFFIMIRPSKKSKHSKLKKIKNEEIKNLQNFFKKLYEENEAALKKGRLKILLWDSLLVALFAVPLIIVIVFCYLMVTDVVLKNKDFSFYENILLTVPYVAFVAMFIMFLLQDKIKGKIYGAKRDVKQIYKKEMLGEFLKFVNTGLNYSEYLPQNSGLENDYDFLEYGQLLNESYIDNVDDYFCGYIGDKYIEMADIKFVCEGRKGDFNGRFASVLAKNVVGDVDIIAKSGLILNRSKYVWTGVRKFDKYFLVKKDEQKDLFTIFDKNFLEFLGDFTEKTGIVFDLFVKDKIYIKFYVGNIFEPKLFGEMIDEYSMYKFVMIMNLLRELAERL